MRFFRESLTALAALLAIALLALVVVPPFFDWNGQRTRIATLVSERFGIEMRIAGDLRLTLLPNPEFDAEGVEIGPVGQPLLRAERLTISLAPSALLAGSFRASAARIDRADILIDALSGLVARGGDMIAPRGAGIDRLDIRNAAFLRAGQASRMADDAYAGLDLMIEAPSLAGPFRVDIADARRARDLRVQIGKLEDGRARMKGVFEDKQGASRASFDGWLALAKQGGLPGFDGALQFNGNPLLGGAERGVQLPYDGSARVIAGADQIILDPVNIAIGSGEQALQLAGNGFVELGRARPVAQMQLSARRFEPAPLLAPREGQPERVVDWRAISSFLHASPDLKLPFDLGLVLGVSTLQFKDGAAQDASLHLAFDARGLRAEAFSLKLPGQAEMTYQRAQRAGASLFDGRIDFESREPAALIAFLRGGHTPAQLPPSFKLSSGVLSSGSGIEMPGLFLASDAGAMSGSGSLVWPEPGQRNEPRLSFDLAASRFDARMLAAIDPLRPVRGIEIGTRLAVGVLVVDGAELGGLDVALERDGALASLKQFRLRGRKGEELSLSGSASGDALHLTGKLDAETLSDIARLAGALLPGAATEALIRRAKALEPAIAVGTLRVETRSGEAIWDIVAEGQLGGTRLNAKSHSTLRDNDLRISLEGELANENGARLIAQLTGAAPSARPSLPGRLSLKAEGNPRRAVSGTLNGAISGIDISASASFNPFRSQGVIEGQVGLETGDLGVLHQALGGGVPEVAPGTRARFRSRLFGDAGKLTFTGIDARFGDAPLAGEIAFDLTRSGQVAGQIRLDAIALENLVAPVLGAGSAGLDRLDFSRAGFGKPLAPMLSGDLWIEGKQLRIGADTIIEAPQFVLRFAPEAVGFEGFEGRIGAARYSGGLSLIRREGRIDAAGRLGVARAPLPGIVGRLSGELPFTASGASLFELAASLGGAGRVQVEGLVVPDADIRALKRLASRPPEAFGALDENRVGAALEAELKGTPLVLPTLALPVTMLNGQIRLGGTAIEAERLPTPDHAITPGLTLDLSRGFLDARLGIRLRDLPKDWRGAAPEIGLGWSGRIGASAGQSGVRRNLQVSSLVNGLLAVAIQRDLERAEAFGADVRERAWFLRRQRADRFSQRRAAEEAAYLQAEAAREAAEAEQKLRALIQAGEAQSASPQRP